MAEQQRNHYIDPQRDAIRALLREADQTWMPSQPRALFERLRAILDGPSPDTESEGGA